MQAQRPHATLAGLRQRADAFVGEAQDFATIGRNVQTDEARSQQVNLQTILARPACRAPDLHQARAVKAGDRGGGRGVRSGGWQHRHGGVGGLA
ncbi:hypothetical protein D3C71_1503140 [compost metagenome]